MPYGVLWKYEDNAGEILHLIGLPEALEDVESPESARDEGRQMLSEIAEGHRALLRPLATVEVSNGMLDTLRACSTIEIPVEDEEDDPLEFTVVDSTDFWSSQPFWHK